MSEQPSPAIQQQMNRIAQEVCDEFLETKSSRNLVTVKVSGDENTKCLNTHNVLIVIWDKIEDQSDTKVTDIKGKIVTTENDYVIYQIQIFF